ncbi:hypothetical protein BdWA1_002552 [Babesia duncani]|uniref:Uncharacterized protein n=1 Tax=Babesia duncani TaxID=323732 RepID=A0AAD9UNJ3_9APIC|nr:hypothetical protein BdWA1_002552 [Babesia duncani]
MTRHSLSNLVRLSKNAKQSWKDSIKSAREDIFGSIKGLPGESEWVKPLLGPSRTNWYWPSKYLHLDFSLRHYLAMQIGRFKPKMDYPVIGELREVISEMKANKKAVYKYLKQVDLETFAKSSTLQDIHELYYVLFGESASSQDIINQRLDYLKGEKWVPFISYVKNCSNSTLGKNTSEIFNKNTMRQMLSSDENILKCLKTRNRFIDALYQRRRAYYLHKLGRKKQISETIQKYKQHFLEHPDHKQVWPDNKGITQHKWPSR